MLQLKRKKKSDHALISEGRKTVESGDVLGRKPSLPIFASVIVTNGERRLRGNKTTAQWRQSKQTSREGEGESIIAIIIRR